MKLKDAIYLLQSILYGVCSSISSVVQIYNEVWLNVCAINFLQNLLLFFKNNGFFKFNLLNDISVVDYPTLMYRFSVILNLFSYKYAFKMFVKVLIAETDSLLSFSAIYKNAIWLEREIWDMFGIFFVGNPDLRRLLTDYGFEGFPLRKDFPLGGYLEIRYDDEKMSLVYEKVEFAQEFRIFTFISPWETL